MGDVDELRIGPDRWAPALEDIAGRQIIVAGPGTGKTEFLVRRVAGILERGDASPSQVVVLSFSRRSSAKLKTRIETRIGSTGVPVAAATFHSLAIRLAEASSGQRPLPLTTPEQVNLVVQNGVLTISGQKEPPATVENEHSEARYSERWYGHFERSFTLPGSVEADDIRASCDNGVLTIELRKAEQARPRRVAVTAGHPDRQLASVEK